MTVEEARTVLHQFCLRHGTRTDGIAVLPVSALLVTSLLRDQSTSAVVYCPPDGPSSVSMFEALATLARAGLVVEA